MMGRVLFETDDPLNEANLGEFIAHQNNRDYIDTHPTVNANWSANELGLGSSRSWIFFDDRLYTVLPDSETVTLPNESGENFVFVTFDPETRDSPAYVATESEGDVSDPKLLVFVADTSTESVDARNAAPDIDAEVVEAVAASVESEPTDATDVARKAETDALSDDLDGLDAAKADTPHDLAGDDHSEDTLENLNSKVLDADLATDPHGNENHEPNFAEDPHGEGSHTAEVLHDGQNFDGEDESEFTNVSSIDLLSGTIQNEATGPTDIPQFSQVQQDAIGNITQQEEPEIESAGTLWTRFARPFSFSTASNNFSGIAVSDGLVFAGSDDNNLYAINISEGTEEWSFSADGNIDSGIAVSDGLVFAGSDDNNLYAVDINDGTEEWSFSTGGSVQTGIAVSDGLVFVGSFDDNLYAININDGTEEWSFSTGSSVRSGIAVSDGLVFAGSNDNNLYAVNINDGTEEWSFSTGGSVQTGIAVSDALVFAGSFDDNLYAVNINDGTEEWSFSTGGAVQSGIAVSDALVFTGSNDDNLYAVNINDGTEEWSFSTGGFVQTGIAVSDGLVFAGSNDNNLYAVNINDGTEEWSFSTGGVVQSAIAVSDALVFAGSDDNNLYARVNINGSGRRSSIISVSDGDNWVTQA